MNEFNLPESLDGLTSEELQGLHDAALGEFNTLNESEDLSIATIDRMSELADAIEALRGRQQTLAQAATRLAAARSRVAASVETPPDPQPQELGQGDQPNPAPAPDPNQQDREANPGDDGVKEPQPPSTTASGGALVV